jgi:hypothetical protein
MAELAVETYCDPLLAVRRVLAGANEALLGVAFVERRGVNLVARQLRAVRRTRLIAITVFGSTTEQGLSGASKLGVHVRVLNRRGGTFHPKVYLGRHGDQLRPPSGTSSTFATRPPVRFAVAVLAGPARDPQLRGLWELAESWWADPAAVAWTAQGAPAVREVLEPTLLAAIQAAVATDPVVWTLGDPQRNLVHEVTEDGVWVETDKSVRKGNPPQRVDAWMIQIAWEWLLAHGWLTYRWLLADDGLNVKRSSFVCALLARLPGVRVQSRRPIKLVLDAER